MTNSMEDPLVSAASALAIQPLWSDETDEADPDDLCAGANDNSEQITPQERKDKRSKLGAAVYLLSVAAKNDVGGSKQKGVTCKDDEEGDDDTSEEKDEEPEANVGVVDEADDIDSSVPDDTDASSSHQLLDDSTWAGVPDFSTTTVDGDDEDDPRSMAAYSKANNNNNTSSLLIPSSKPVSFEEVDDTSFEDYAVARFFLSCLSAPPPQQEESKSTTTKDHMRRRSRTTRTSPPRSGSTRGFNGDTIESKTNNHQQGPHPTRTYSLSPPRSGSTRGFDKPDALESKSKTNKSRSRPPPQRSASASAFDRDALESLKSSSNHRPRPTRTISLSPPRSGSTRGFDKDALELKSSRNHRQSSRPPSRTSSRRNLSPQHRMGSSRSFDGDVHVGSRSRSPAPPQRLGSSKSFDRDALELKSSSHEKRRGRASPPRRGGSARSFDRESSLEVKSNHESRRHGGGRKQSKTPSPPKRSASSRHFDRESNPHNSSFSRGDTLEIKSNHEPRRGRLSPPQRSVSTRSFERDGMESMSNIEFRRKRISSRSPQRSSSRRSKSPQRSSSRRAISVDDDDPDSKFSLRSSSTGALHHSFHKSNSMKGGGAFSKSESQKNFVFPSTSSSTTSSRISPQQGSRMIRESSRRDLQNRKKGALKSSLMTQRNQNLSMVANNMPTKQMEGVAVAADCAAGEETVVTGPATTRKETLSKVYKGEIDLNNRTVAAAAATTMTDTTSAGRTSLAVSDLKHFAANFSTHSSGSTSAFTFHSSGSASASAGAGLPAPAAFMKMQSSATSKNRNNDVVLPMVNAKPTTAKICRPSTTKKDLSNSKFEGSFADLEDSSCFFMEDSFAV